MELGKASSPFSNGDISQSCPPHLRLSVATASEHFTIILPLIILHLLPSQFNLSLPPGMKWRHISSIEQSYGQTSWQPQQVFWFLIPNEGWEVWCCVKLVHSLSIWPVCGPADCVNRPHIFSQGSPSTLESLGQVSSRDQELKGIQSYKCLSSREATATNADAGWRKGVTSPQGGALRSPLAP